MPLIWTRTKDDEHNGRPTYEYHATCEDRTYHIVWAYDAGFGYTATRKTAEGATEYLSPTDRHVSSITWARTLKACKGWCEEIDKKWLGRERTIFGPQIAGSFETFQDWVNSASRRIGEAHCPTDTVGHVLRAICVDAKGRRCQCGGDFMRARDEGAFPVRYFWDLKPETINVGVS